MLEKLERSLNEVGEDLSKEPAEEASTSKPSKKVKKVAKKVTKKANGKAESKKAKASDDGKVSLAALASEAGITTAAARRKLRAAELSREGRWSWDDGSKGLKDARKALDLK